MSTILFGRPLANVQVHVLDRLLQPCPVGVPGELYLGGVQVARGYLRQPALTAERFLPDPFSNIPGARMYRSGDVVRWTPDGELAYLGRVDEQVKVRGFRIELGEVESVLAAHPELAQAVVVAREETPGIKQLVGYVVPATEIIPTPADLRAHMAQFLPDYMVPAAFSVLDSLPLSANWKVDRQALPAPETAGVGRAVGVEEDDQADLLAPRPQLLRDLVGDDAGGAPAPRQ